MSELYNEIMELFGSCQDANVKLAEAMVEGQKIDKVAFLKHIKFDTLGIVGAKQRTIHFNGQFAGRSIVHWDWLWGQFLDVCYTGKIIVERENSIEAVRVFQGLRKFVWKDYNPLFLQVDVNSAMRNAPPDLSPLSDLQNLQGFEFGYHSNVGALPHLYRFDADNQVDLTPLSKCHSLLLLHISAANIHNIEPLAKLKNLESVRLNHCYLVKSYKPLKELPNLRDLWLSEPEDYDDWQEEHKGKPHTRELEEIISPARDAAELRKQAFLNYGASLFKNPTQKCYFATFKYSWHFYQPCAKFAAKNLNPHP